MVVFLKSNLGMNVLNSYIFVSCNNRQWKTEDNKEILHTHTHTMLNNTVPYKNI